MIKYKKVYSWETDAFLTISEISKKIPVHYISGHSYEDYTIPFRDFYFLHRDVGPAKISYISNKKEWWWYGYRADSEDQWLDTNWRKRVEIQRFI